MTADAAVLVLLRDVQARVVRLVEALDDGEHGFARALADDLARDVWRIVESCESGRGGAR